ncbi:unnamed protein product [Bursaphelenchus okinawaensis]|uniref:EF-hand domain-containing protein n=1 Tax=Bursaphelenchus okinawaensis TaxID=465554 RepID=A0A811L3M4_9BILA|nr:unnamed protein product [Bursaphelenchus okinawaensis]CAG9116704.1 unnamed protein product [Bursaphelenchus okinawaensis]
MYNVSHSLKGRVTGHRSTYHSEGTIMFSGKNPFIHDPNRHIRRQSQFERQLHACFAEPPAIFANVPAMDSIVHRLYWALRSAQFKVFYKTEEADEGSINELIKFEPTERPPSLDQLSESTRNQFSKKWVKYMYAKFKNECPTGRMSFREFKRLFGSYMPHRSSDAYLERMFKAFLHTSSYPDQLTFKDLIVCLAYLHQHDTKFQAEWTMRLINGNSSSRISLHEFREFVLSVFMLTGGDPAKRVDSIIPMAHSPFTDQIAHLVGLRAGTVFQELDKEQRGYLTVEDLEKLYRQREQQVL